MVVGSCNVDCKTYDSFLKAYVGGATIDTLSNFVNGCIVVPIQARTQYYEPGVVSITVNSDNWIRVQCDTETVAEVRCLLISQSSQLDTKEKLNLHSFVPDSGNANTTFPSRLRAPIPPWSVGLKLDNEKVV